MADKDDADRRLTVHERIERLAYLLWEVAGRHQGMALDFWLAAEREILKKDDAAAAEPDNLSGTPATDEPLNLTADDTPPASR